MNGSLAKVRHSVRAIGVLPTLLRAARYARFMMGRREISRRTREILRVGDIEDRFTLIYESNYWGSSESASGAGSTQAHTAKLRAELPALFAGTGIRRVFDAPCGDFAWMPQLLDSCAIDYTGGDIVAPMIERLSNERTTPAVRFRHVDITRGPFPKVDLWLCRDCLFHLSYRDIRKALDVFVASGIPYLLTTTHENPNGFFINTDIESGDFRRIDLFAAPFFFPSDVLAQVDDWHDPEPPRKMMCLWTREQIASALNRWRV